MRKYTVALLVLCLVGFAAPAAGAQNGDTGTLWSFDGFAEIAYTWNLNQPRGTFGTDPDPSGENNFRIFDKQHNNFDLNAVGLNASKQATDDSWVGFQTFLLLGQDADFIHSTGLFEGESIDLVDAYLTIKVPEDVISLPTSFKVGKFQTIFGTEVITGPANMNYSRSYQFGYAIPFVHTGVFGDMTLLQRGEENGEMLGIGAGLVNGWDNVVDSNDAKSVMGQVRFNPCDHFQTNAGIILGPERMGNGDWRGLVEINGTVSNLESLEGLSISGNFDYGWEDATPASVGGVGGYSTWWGFAGYLKYELTRWESLNNWYIAFRGEYFNDVDGSRTGTNFAGGTRGPDFVGVTTTLGYQPWKNFLIRLEHRYDTGSDDLFQRKSDSVRDHQNTFSMSMALFF